MIDKNVVVLSSQKSINWMKGKGYPYSDMSPLKRSSQEFSGGGQYGVEMPVINSFKVLEKTIDLLEKEGVYCCAFNETLGAYLLSDSEVSDMLNLCREKKYGFVFSIGPRPEHDIKASFYRSEFGLEQGRSINNNDGVRASIEEIFRLVELGCTGITFYDLGVLKMASELRSDGLIPNHIKFKTSSHLVACNPMIAKVYSDIGADSIVTTHDLALPVLQGMREMCPDTIFDVPTDCYKSKGNYIRFYEMAEMVQCVAPIMLKMGASAQGHPHDQVKESVVLERIQRVKVGQAILDKHLDVKTRMSLTSDAYCLPVSK